MIRILSRTIEWILITLLSVMTLVVLWGIFTRYFLSDQASWSEELARFLLIWISLLGAAYVSGIRKHLSIDLLESYLSPIRQRRLKRFVSTLIILFSITVMILGGLRLIFITNVLGQTSAALHIPMYLVYTIIPVSGLIIVIYEISYLMNWNDEEENVSSRTRSL